MTAPNKTFRFKNIRGICLPEFYPGIEKMISDWNRWVDDPKNRFYMKRPNRVVGMSLPEPLKSGGLGPDLQIVAKEFGWRNPLNRLLSPLGESRAFRSFRIGTLLHLNGVSTPRPLAAWEIRKWGFVSKSVYLCREIQEAVPVRQFLKDHPVRDKRLASALKDLAGLVRGMHDTGVFHRDLTLGNFLAAPAAPGSDEIRLSVIDLSRAVRLPAVPVFLRLIDLARMKLLNHWDFFYAGYCGERTGWRGYRPLLDRMIRLRRKKMAAWKGLKKVFKG